MSDDEKPKLEVVRPNFGDQPVVIDHTSREVHCNHDYVALRQGDRTVVCRVCHRPVEAFDVLVRLSHKWANVDYVKGQAKEARAQLDELKAEEQNVKSRLRAAYKKVEPHPRAAAYVDELVRRLGDVSTYSDLQDVRSWAYKFRWVDSAQTAAIEAAFLRAENRVKENRKSNRVRRKVRVIDGGAGKEEATTKDG